MLLLKFVVRDTLVNLYNQTNDIDKACELTNKSFKGISIIKEIYDDYYKITIRTAIKNTMFTDELDIILIKK